MDNPLHQAAETIRLADALLITAGAGMGVDSGLPDFRGNEGFWKAYPVAERLGLSFAELADPRWFKNDPFLAWAFYGHRLDLYRRTIPHAGFVKLLAWGASKPEGYFVFTSNVDGHFQKAGFDAARVVECHGSIHHFQCLNNCAGSIWDATEEQVWVNETLFRAEDPLPRCRFCGALARPNVLMFGDFAWLEDRTAAQHHRFQLWLQDLKKKSARLAIIELGAGMAVPTVRITSEQVARRMGGSLVRLNPRESAVPPGHIGLATSALEGIRELEKLL